ncbi:crossover junction endodeoxyribonuclease RuvC [Candidatus Uhrbacteria bacterium RIFCSPLOWO2_02_FULL_49_11]|uniref:Crossover junction endodeoxyribonuclease RuvC n=1 Tax=Candidatus Uhrbacteria bacterium RIFCSPLOWO2_02_FULL_49_11 TaxID=1802409 RepID=A0A1F7VCF2_9BACT|nr:MAG: crossover junction endodeoxyribonuclease RuvC [Candidatus Uhrbacteria bacterium RIFCSPLOWO2_02_FULL_49_11]
MITLGIDPGLATTGYAFISSQRGTVKNIRWGCITTKPHQPTAARLLILRKGLRKLIAAHRPHRAAIEKLYFQTNAKTAMIVGEARGALITTLAELSVPISEFTPLEIKRAVTGSGNADKRQVQKMLTLLFHLDEPPKPDDAADAVAIAWCGMCRRLA